MAGVVTKFSVVFALLSCAVLQLTIHQAATAGNCRRVLQLLLVLNLQQGPMEEWVPSWEMGFEILPAANLAIDKINHRSSMASVEVDGYSMLQSNRLECEAVNFHQTHMYMT